MRISLFICHRLWRDRTTRAGVCAASIATAAAIVIFSWGVTTAQAASGAAQKSATAAKTVTVFPHGNDAGKRTFSVVLLCDTVKLREQGLQGFRPLGPREAALFVFERYEAVTFWMGSVTFPIDIIFNNPRGSVVKVAPDCKPGSAELYGSGVPVKWVVETAAGSGIEVGDRVVPGFRAGQATP